MNTSSSKIFLLKVYRLLYRELTSVYDFLALVFHLPCLPDRNGRMSQLPKVVFIGDGLMPRISRIAKWLRRDGNYSTILIANKISFVEQFSNAEWDGVFLFRNRFHLKRILTRIRGVYLYHAFAPKSYYPDYVRRLVKEPFLIDMQDVFTCYYGLNPAISWLRKELLLERKCLLHADGVVAHSLEPNAGYRKIEAGTKPPAIFFPIYCDNDIFLGNQKKLVPNDIHIVYAGGVAGSHRDKKHYGSIQFHDLIRVLEEQNINFHIYPSPSNARADYEEYEHLARNSAYFHFHQPVSQDSMAAELNQYHFGILPFFSAHSSQSDEKYKYATSLKLFNYIEAGLPVLVSEDLIYQSWIIRRYDAGIEISNNDLIDLRKVIMAHDYPALVSRLIRRREEISLQRHIPRLLRFYEEIKRRSASNS